MVGWRCASVWLAWVVFLSFCGCGFLFPSEEGPSSDDPSDEESSKCEEICAETECGVPGCHSCNACGPGETCAAGKCISLDDCPQACGDAQCGYVGGCKCGWCPSGHMCGEDLLCHCFPACTNGAGKPLECGDDLCGGVCGECPKDLKCSPLQTCVPPEWPCVSICGIRECGDNGCGGSCGECPDEKAWCIDGKCSPEPCTAPALPFSPNTLRVDSISYGKSGHPGEAFDIDGDPDTCSPAEACSDGRDNEALEFAGQITQFLEMGEALALAVESGQATVLLEFPAPTAAGGDIQINAYAGMESQGCAEDRPEGWPCPYQVQADGLGLDACLPLWTFAATVDDVILEAGGSDVVVPWPTDLAVFLPVRLVPAYNVHVAAEVVLGDGGKVLGLKDGLLGGAVRKQDILDYAKSSPASRDLPISNDGLLNLLQMFLVPDVDTDKDLDLDAVSFAHHFTASPVQVVGVGLPPGTVQPSR